MYAHVPVKCVQRRVKAAPHLSLGWSTYGFKGPIWLRDKHGSLRIVHILGRSLGCSSNVAAFINVVDMPHATQRLQRVCKPPLLMPTPTYSCRV